MLTALASSAQCARRVKHALGVRGEHTDVHSHLFSCCSGRRLRPCESRKEGTVGRAEDAEDADADFDSLVVRIDDGGGAQLEEAADEDAEDNRPWCLRQCVSG